MSLVDKGGGMESWQGAREGLEELRVRVILLLLSWLSNSLQYSPRSTKLEMLIFGCFLYHLEQVSCILGSHHNS